MLRRNFIFPLFEDVNEVAVIIELEMSEFVNNIK